MKPGEAKPLDEVKKESSVELFDNLLKMTQVLDCGGEDPELHLERLFKEGGARAVFNKLADRQRSFAGNRRVLIIRERLSTLDHIKRSLSDLGT